MGLPILILVSLALAEAVDRSEYVTEVNHIVDQPVPFSHEHHVAQIGIDCRYCHTQVEKGPVAQIPSSEICMTCHSQIWKESPVLEPVRRSHETGQPLHWNKVTKLPDFVYFNHSIHVKKGVACTSCHGEVEKMALPYLAHPMEMEFCLNCHRNPSPHLRPRDQVVNPNYQPALPQEILGVELMKKYDVQKKLDCITCHR